MTNQRALKTIIYDFDGTIADSMQAVITIYNRLAGEKGFKPVTKENLETLRGQGPRQVLKELGVSLYQIPRALLRGRKEVRPAIKNMGAQPGIKQLLYKLKDLGYQQGIISTNAEENVKQFLQNNDIDIFDFISCDNSAFGKAKALKKILAANDLAPEQAIYIGDEVRDIEAARQAKVKIVSVAWGYNNPQILKQHNPDALIEKPDELIKIAELL